VIDQSPARGRILVVDDDLSFCESIAALLEITGYETETATSGEAALASVRESAPAAILLDVNMPGLSGYEVCRAIKQDLELALPVVFLSGHRTEPLDRVAGLLIGADDYLTKPVAPDELFARLRVLLRRSTSAPRRSSLSGRELEVLSLLAEGLDQAAIAERLVISPKTVATHIERILVKLDAHSRAQAVAIAYRLQLVPVPA
jgi:DNA-binding response OmpR family regulator